MAMAAATTPTTTPTMIGVVLVDFEDDVPPSVGAVSAAEVAKDPLANAVPEAEGDA